jgi:pimeloyl-ACP methyl ester carboxylesterase
MPAQEHDGRVLDARPDRPDIRDRVYAPPLRSLPTQFPPERWIHAYFDEYTQRGLILDQGQEGACTGFGLAALINYLQFRHFAEERFAAKQRNQSFTLADPQRVSPRMLYHLARRYDEWPGEDYSGSSCRGAVKGWFHHGVCLEDLWPYLDQAGKANFVEPSDGWDLDAAIRPLGAYYRITTDAIADLQAAIFEVGSVYASATVHAGWWLKETPELEPIRYPGNRQGGHAFALVGYNADGFIVQNSWGPDWGFRGFAILTYADWLESASDAWVATMGAPIAGRAPSVMLSSERTVPTNMPAHSRGLSNGITAAAIATPAARSIWSTAEALNRALVLGNEGLPDQLIIDVENAAKAVERVCYTKPLKFFSDNGPGAPPRIMIYAHGGLNDLNAALARTKILGPLFEGNNVYPIFVCWQTGYVGSIVNRLEDWVRGEAASATTARARSIMEKLSEARDYALEAVAVPIARPVWSEMKENGIKASQGEDGGMSLLAGHLERLRDKFDKLEIHLIGHSAGAIVQGGLLSVLGDRGLKARSLTLYAPACTVRFAREHFLPAVARGTIAKSAVAFDILSEANERTDTVGPYGKSLLYLISRALERKHKTAILGMEAAWRPELARKEDVYNPESLDEVTKWVAAWGDPGRNLRILKDASVPISTVKTIKAAHGCFDNWVGCIKQSVHTCLGLELHEALPFAFEEIGEF